MCSRCLFCMRVSGQGTDFRITRTLCNRLKPSAMSETSTSKAYVARLGSFDAPTIFPCACVHHTSRDEHESSIEAPPETARCSIKLATESSQRATPDAQLLIVSSTLHSLLRRRLHTPSCEQCALRSSCSCRVMYTTRCSTHLLSPLQDNALPIRGLRAASQPLIASSSPVHSRVSLSSYFV